MPKIVKMRLNLLKLFMENCRSFFLDTAYRIGSRLDAVMSTSLAAELAAVCHIYDDSYRSRWSVHIFDRKVSSHKPHRNLGGFRK